MSSVSYIRLGVDHDQQDQPVPRHVHILDTEFPSPSTIDHTFMKNKIRSTVFLRGYRFEDLAVRGSNSLRNIPSMP